MTKIILAFDKSHFLALHVFKYLHIDMSKQNLFQSENFNVLAEALKSIGHPERIAILELICNCRQKHMTVKSIYKVLELEQPIVSRHLGIMKRAGLLKKEVEGRNTYYYLNTENPACECVQRMFSK